MNEGIKPHFSCPALIEMNCFRIDVPTRELTIHVHDVILICKSKVSDYCFRK